MKYLKFFSMALFAIYLTSCTGGGSITPVSKKVNGPLGMYFDVIERDYKISEDELNVEFKRIAEGGPTNASWSSRPTFTVELQDDDGNVISSESTDVVFSESQLETVFSLGVNESSSITFKFSKSEGAVKFKVSSKWEHESESSSSSYSDEEDEKKAYEDDSDNPYEWLSERLVTEDDLVGKSLDELRIMRNTIYAMHGYIFKTADMKAHFGKLSWYQAKKDDVSSELSSIENKNVMFIKNHESNGGVSRNDSYSYSSSSGSEDWDAMLKAYEEYVDKYIVYVEKAATGDMTALAEYPALMEKAQELSDKIQKAKGNMSIAQWERYNRITMKMASAAQEIRKRK